MSGECTICENKFIVPSYRIYRFAPTTQVLAKNGSIAYNAEIITSLVMRTRNY